MATTTIAGLTATTSPADTDCIIIGSTNAYKMTFAQLKALIKEVCLPLSGGTLNGDVTLPESGNLAWASSAHIYSSKNQTMRICPSNESSYEIFAGVRDSIWSLAPAVSGNIYLGSTNYKWKSIYATSSTINTSDRNEKHDIEPLNEDVWIDFLRGINVVSYKLNESDSDRTHHGMIAQDIEALLAEMGIDTQDFAGFVKWQKTKPVERTREEIDKNGNKITVKYTEDIPLYDDSGNLVYGYGLRYEEFLPMTIKAVQHLCDENEKLTQSVNELTQKLNSLTQKVEALKADMEGNDE